MKEDPNVWLVHGIRSFDADDTMGPLVSALTEYGIRARVIDYGYILFPITNSRARKAIRKKAKPGDVLVGYSNGAAAVHKAADKVCPRHVIEISPAMKVDAAYHECVDSVTCFYSPGDNAVAVGGVYAWTVNMLPWRWGSARQHPWGRRGIDGPSDPAVNGIEMCHNIEHSWFKYDDTTHMIAKEIAWICGVVEDGNGHV